MVVPYLGEIQLFGFDFAPHGWAQCIGGLLPVSQNTRLYSLLGNTFGGDGNMFMLPDFHGRAACGTGAGPGLTPRAQGERFGKESVTLDQSEMPPHSHDFHVFNQRDAAKRHGTPKTGDAITVPATALPFVRDVVPSGEFPPKMIGMAGASQPHPNQQPYLVVNFCIALDGEMPRRP